MDQAPQHLPLRDARDRLIERLKLGQTLPSRDLLVHTERLIIAPNLDAKLAIEQTQRDCTYQLWHGTDDVQIERVAGSTSTPVEAVGTGGTIVLLTPVLTADCTYRIRVIRKGTGRWAYLHQRADIQIGLDLSLPAEIRDAALVDPEVESPSPTDPRIVDQGQTVEVEVEDSQEGVDYRLVQLVGSDPVELSQQDVRGNLGTIVLLSQPIDADVDIRVMATSVYESAPGQGPLSALLDVTLPLVVQVEAPPS